MLYFKQSVLILFFSFTAIYSQAQGFGGGIYGGLTSNQVDGDNLGGFDLTGFHFGAYTDWNLKDKLRLQGELAFIMKGSREPNSDTSNFYKLRLNYIEIPLLFYFRNKQLSYFGGPALDILVSASEEDISGPRVIFPEFYTFNLTGIIGVSYHFNENWSLDFRTNYSITPTREGSAPTGSQFLFARIGKAGQRNLTLSTALLYTFD